MRLCVLGSGSRGNAIVVEHRQTTILIDCGFGPREFARRCARRNINPAEINAVIITHEHQDHAGGLPHLAKTSAGASLWMTAGTARALNVARDSYRPLSPDTPLAIGDLQILPYTVSHDAEEPAQIVADDGARRAAILTDAGCITPAAQAAAADCDALILECNYDAAMLANNLRYPPRIKARIASRFGHLENGEAAGLLAEVAKRRLRRVIAAHLSAANNTAELARAALAAAVGASKSDIAVATQADGCDWVQL
jgi:phosphoribosyl 1,2-cyclic phosphodiesterase